MCECIGSESCYLKSWMSARDTDFILKLWIKRTKCGYLMFWIFTKGNTIVIWQRNTLFDSNTLRKPICKKVKEHTNSMRTYLLAYTDIQYASLLKTYGILSISIRTYVRTSAVHSQNRTHYPPVAMQAKHRVKEVHRLHMVDQLSFFSARHRIRIVWLGLLTSGSRTRFQNE